MTTESNNRIAEAFRERTPIDQAMNAVGKAAIEAHRRDGVPLVVWCDGRVVYLDPTTLKEVPADTAQDNSVSPHIENVGP